jgi:hypothetical protein
MKLSDIGNLDNFGLSTRLRKVGNWSYRDTIDSSGMQRLVYHHGTEMAFFLNEGDGWSFFPSSVGWGSVSDQQGMNKIAANYGWRYIRRNGNPMYEFKG